MVIPKQSGISIGTFYYLDVEGLTQIAEEDVNLVMIYLVDEDDL